MNDGRTSRQRVLRIGESGAEAVDDAVVVEEPLEIRIGDRPLAVTMRTPGDDFDLATGFLVTEAIVERADDIESLRHWGSPNVVRAALREGVTIDFERLRRNFYATSSCGICGKASIDALRVHARPIDGALRIEAKTIGRLPGVLRSHQPAFDETGAIHGAAIFDRDATPLRVREDIGRHNAVDKAIGSLLRDGAALDQTVLAVSGRVSFEIVQKALIARVPVVAGVGGASSLAIALAREFGLTLIGFAREGSFNVYAGEERVG